MTVRRRTALHLPVALFLLLSLLAATGTWYVLSLRAEVANTASRARELVKLASSAASQERFDVEAARQSLGLLRANIDRLEGRLAPLGPLLPYLGWVPVVGGDLRAAPHLLAAASALTDVGELALEVAPSIQKLVAAPGTSSLALAGLRDALEQQRPTLEQGLKDAGRVREQLRAIDPAGLTFSQRAYADLQLFAAETETIFALVLEARGYLDSASQTLEFAQAFGSLSGDPMALWDRLRGECGSLASLRQSVASLDTADTRVHDLWARLKVLPSAPGARGAFLLLDAPVALAQGGLQALEAACSLATALDEGVNLDKLSVHLDGILAGAEVHLALADERVKRTQAILEEAKAAGAPTRATEALQGEFARLRDGVALGEQAVSLARRFLGYDGPQRYLVLGANHDELRGSGGYIPAVWLLTLERSRLTETRFWYSYEVDDMTRLGQYPPPPEAMYRYMWAGYWLLRDAGWYPDFPTTAKVATKLFALGQGETVDGVIGLDQEAIVYVMQVLGPISVEGVQKRIDASNVVDFFYAEPGVTIPFEGRQKPKPMAISKLAETLAERLHARLSRQETEALAQALWRAVREKHLMLYLHDPEAAALLGRYSLDGALRPSDGDFLMLAENNLYSSKVNQFVDRALRYTVELGPDGSAQGKVEITFRNFVPRYADSCQQGVAYFGAGRSCYYNYLRLYLPPGTQLLTAPVLPLPEGTFYEMGGQPPIPNTVRIAPSEGDKTVVEGFMVVPMSAIRTLAFTFRLPATVLRETPAGLRYSLLLQKQPGLLSVPVRVRVEFPDKWSVSEASPQESARGPGWVEFNLELARDQEIELLLAR